MKLRIRGNSLRLRLGPAEVDRLASGGSVEDSITFGSQAGQTLRYAIESTTEVNVIAATFYGNSIRVLLPLTIAACWARGAEVGIETAQMITADAVLKVLIEKDFKCLDSSSVEDQPDVYPNPKEGGDCRADLSLPGL